MSHLWLQGLGVAAPSSVVTSWSARQWISDSLLDKQLRDDCGQGASGTPKPPVMQPVLLPGGQVALGSVPALITVSTSHIKHPGERRIRAAREWLCLYEYLMTPCTMKRCSGRREMNVQGGQNYGVLSSLLPNISLLQAASSFILSHQAGISRVRSILTELNFDVHVSSRSINLRGSHNHLTPPEAPKQGAEARLSPIA